MNENIELKVGDVVRTTAPFTAVISEETLSLNITVEVGSLFTVAGFSGANVLLQRTLKWDLTHLDFVLQVDPKNLQAFTPIQSDEGGETEPPAVEPPEENMCEKMRYSTATIKATTKRPEVFLYQGANSAIDPDYAGGIDGWYGAGSAEDFKKFQAANGLDDDGIIGRNSATELIKQANAAGFQPDLNLRIMSVIAYYEVSNRRDAFGMAENDIGDNAGANYGIWQCNSYGSVVSMLKLAGRNDLVAVYNGSDKKVVNPTIQDWFGSTEGIKTQVRYLEEKLLPIAMRELNDFGVFGGWADDPGMKTYWERAVLLFVDSVVQNGTMWSSSRKPFWRTLTDEEAQDPHGYKWPELYHGTWWDEMLGEYIKYDDMKELWWAEFNKHGGTGYSIEGSVNKAACEKANISTAQKLCIENCASNPEAQLVVVAQFRSRSSWDKYWYQAVASRRITDATGNSANHPSGVVNGGKLDLACDYQI